jgi:hypothetical protein
MLTENAPLLIFYPDYSKFHPEKRTEKGAGSLVKKRNLPPESC